MSEFTYVVEARGMPFDHPFQVTVERDGKFEAGYLGQSEEELIRWAENYIGSNR